MQYLKRIAYILVPIALLSLVWFGRYNLYDWYRLRGYRPPAEVVQLATDTAMTDYGRRLFYVNHPDVSDKSSFNQSCTISEQTIVLGCYASGRGIYLYDVTDERLHGVEQVTAAHEMLHAAYERLSRADQKRIDALTDQVFLDLQDERIQQTVESYRSRDPSVVPNELHSILATEVESLPAELDAHYARYFADRQKVVVYAKQYEAAFSERKAKIAAYDAQLADLRSEVDQIEADLGQQEKQLGADRKQLDVLLAAKRYDEYNAAIVGFNSRVRAYNTDVAKVRSLIEQFNSIVIARNAIALEENQLAKAIDSRPDTIPTE